MVDVDAERALLGWIALKNLNRKAEAAIGTVLDESGKVPAVAIGPTALFPLVTFVARRGATLAAATWCNNQHGFLRARLFP